MRVTDAMRYAAATAQSARAAENLLKTTRQASTGMRVERPSDDPFAWATSVAKSGQMEAMAARRDAAARARGDLDLAESTLASAADIVARAKELSVQMANGDLGPAERALGAKEVTQLRQALVGIANTRGARGYLFGGSATAAPPFSTAGAFVGNDDVTPLEIAEGVTIAANPSGARAFTAAGGRDIFQDLSDLEQALTNNSVPGVQALLDPLDQDLAQMTTARGEAGLSSQRFSSAADVTTAAIDALRKIRADAVEADPTEAFSRLVEAKSAYERSLEVTKQILALSSVPRFGG